MPKVTDRLRARAEVLSQDAGFELCLFSMGQTASNDIETEEWGVPNQQKGPSSFFVAIIHPAPNKACPPALRASRYSSSESNQDRFYALHTQLLLPLQDHPE